LQGKGALNEIYRYCFKCKNYDLEESIIASGYPMRTKAGRREVEEKDINRGEKLVRATLGGNTAHH